MSPLQLSDFFGVWAVAPSHFHILGALWQRLTAQGVAGPKAEILRALSVGTMPGRGKKTLAVVPLTGLLTKPRNWMGTSTVEARLAIKQAVADDAVSGILLAVNSPGGTVAGSDELAQEVKAARRKKPVFAQIEDLGASAAMHAAAYASEVWANSESAIVGSVGTMWQFLDTKEYQDKLGIKEVAFTTGPMKAFGFGLGISEEQGKAIQAIVDNHQQPFTRAIKSRGLTDNQMAEVLTGAPFAAPRAQQLKLIDGIRGMDKTIQALASAK
jgi:signal peptide peptidase SppA